MKRVRQVMIESSKKMKNASKTSADHQTRAFIRFMEDTLSDNYQITDLFDAIRVIKQLYGGFILKLLVQPDEGMCNFTSDLLYKDGLLEQIDKMHAIVLPTGGQPSSELQLMFQNFKDERLGVCGKGHSTLGYLHLIHKELFITEVKAFMMKTFALHFSSVFSGPERTCMLFYSEGIEFICNLIKSNF
ncbi:uncharacterized protein LOC107035892 [Diachasma alloeum]|uniref:uncharacterized protein LOC107035892 n=1 Tax=Diachasma alloeum TaxID=454923 RepID=UPI0007381281|nr:uncharacterized protein LOC107035892 [Diachasma alloeum]